MSHNICQEEKIIIRKTRRARCLSLRFNARGEIVLTIPFFCPQSKAHAFLESHRDWIKKQRQNRPQPLVFKDGMTVSVLGQSVTITHRPDLKCGVFIEKDQLVVCGEADFTNRRVADFIKRQTAAYIELKARALAAQIGQTICKIHLKDTTSRWGSCSGKKNLNFCWRLGLAPLFVLDYIIAHEVAHLAEMNHSARFWRVVASLTDSRATAEIWLRRHGKDLR